MYYRLYNNTILFFVRFALIALLVLLLDQKRGFFVLQGQKSGRETEAVRMGVRASMCVCRLPLDSLLH